MEQSQHPPAELEVPQPERAPLDSQQAELWAQIMSAAADDLELLLLRESLIYALPPREIYARHPDQFTSVAAIYLMKHTIFNRLQPNQAIARLCATATMAQNQDT
jgi:hypothetical protein